jgi:hypothetical protein
MIRMERNLTDIRRNDSAGFGLCVERMPVAYQRCQENDNDIANVGVKS